jgi:Protein of unknown function (DUF2752)
VTEVLRTLESEVAPRRSAGAAAATGLVLLVQLGVVHAVLSATESRAYLLGHPIGLACAVRARLGVPCPGCGVTRALGFTVHGQIEEALRLFPAAPLAVFGIVAFSFALLAYAAIARWGSVSRGAQLARLMRVAGVVYACTLFVVWLGDWTLRLRAH